MTEWADADTRRDLGRVLLVAVLLRVLYFTQYAAELPFLYGPVADSIVYLEQAFHVQRGELGAAVLLAFSPLYGYFLAALHAGSALVAPVLVQLGMGCATAAVSYVTALRLGGRLAARISAALYLGYGTFLYYESKILSETSSMLLCACALGMYTSDAVRAGRLRAALSSGLLFGFSILARASLVFAAPLLVLAASLPWQTPRERVGVGMRRAAGVALGLALVLGGNGLLTYVHTGLFVPVILVSRTLETASGGHFDGQLSSVKGDAGPATSYDVIESARRRIDDARRGVEQAASSATRIDWAGYVRNAPGKLLRTLTPREITFQYGYNGERAHVAGLRWLPISFGVLLLWGVIGAITLIRREGSRALIPLSPLVLGVLVTTTLYHPSTRYRLAMTLPLLLLAGIGGADVVARWRAGRRGWPGLALAATTLLCAAHVADTSHHRAEFSLQLGMSASTQGDREAQIRHAQDALRAAPDDPSIRQRALLLRDDALQRPR